MQRFKLRTVFIAFVGLALALLTLVSTLININQFSALYYDQIEQEYLPNSVGRISDLNFYRRNNEVVADNWQLTATWGVPFFLGGQSFLCDGFLDWSSATEDQSASMNMTSQFKWALHPLFNFKSMLYIGVEYVYWRNKYGIADSPAFRTHESNVNFLVKAHF